MVLDAADRLGTDLEGWTMVIGGSALTPGLYARARERGMQLFAGYGMSETGPTISLARQRNSEQTDTDRPFSDHCSAGLAAPLVQVRIVDDNMNDIPPDGQSRGELVVRSPWATPSYVGDEQNSQCLWRGGWLHTQDVATVDIHGVIQIRDRLKDVIKTGGEWLDSVQIENLILNAEGIADACVIAIEDSKWGERPLAVVVASPGNELTLDTINRPLEAAIAAGAISRYARLDRFELVDRLPLTSVGKVDKKLLRISYAREMASDPDAGGSSQSY
jgi:fatty-acyl-CoA synthase